MIVRGLQDIFDEIARHLEVSRSLVAPVAMNRRLTNRCSQPLAVLVSSFQIPSILNSVAKLAPQRWLSLFSLMKSHVFSVLVTLLSRAGTRITSQVALKNLSDGSSLSNNAQL
jgi:hypothetical protein